MIQQTIEQDTELLFSRFLDDVDAEWHNASLEQKEYQLHEFLNIECSVGVFTDQVGTTHIKVHYDDSHELIINTTDDLSSIDEQLDKFLLSV